MVIGNILVYHLSVSAASQQQQDVSNALQRILNLNQHVYLFNNVIIRPPLPPCSMDVALLVH
jgi:hypothetical protein